MNRTFAILTTVSILAGCATTPRELRGNFTEIGQAQATLPDSLGENVRWGGEVVGSRDIGDRSCLEVAALRPEPKSQRPDDGYPWMKQPSAGPHFLACSVIRFDRDVSKPGSIATFTGSVQPPSIVQVPRESCRSYRQYGATVHAADVDTCVIALATVAVEKSYVWPERPSYGIPTPPQGPNSTWY